ARPVNFDLSPDRLIELKKGGVPEHVILAMIGRAESVDVADEGWDDDEMPLGGLGRTGGGRTGAPGPTGHPGTDQGEVGIFGSSGSPSSTPCAPRWAKTRRTRSRTTGAFEMAFNTETRRQGDTGLKSYRIKLRLCVSASLCLILICIPTASTQNRSRPSRPAQTSKAPAGPYVPPT